GILARSPEHAEGMVFLTETIRSKEDYKAAEQFLAKVSQKETAHFHLATANLAMLRGDGAAAKAGLERAISLAPKLPSAHLAMASLHVAQKNAPGALASFRTAAELSPVRSIARLKYAAYLSQSGSLPE